MQPDGLKVVTVPLSLVLLQVPELRGFTGLRKLELSYNNIGSLAPLSSLGCVGLRDLYLANNAIQHMQVPTTGILYGLSAVRYGAWRGWHSSTAG